MYINNPIKITINMSSKSKVNKKSNETMDKVVIKAKKNLIANLKKKMAKYNISDKDKKQIIKDLEKETVAQKKAKIKKEQLVLEKIRLENKEYYVDNLGYLYNLDSTIRVGSFRKNSVIFYNEVGEENKQKKIQEMEDEIEQYRLS
jgi:hypothetical protein